MWKVDGQELNRCPIRIVTKEYFDYIHAFILFEKGVLPNADGWVFQSAKFLEAMRVIAQVVIKASQERMNSNKD